MNKKSQSGSADKNIPSYVDVVTDQKGKQWLTSSNLKGQGITTCKPL